MLQIYRQVSLKLNKDKCHFRCTSVPFFGEVISRHDVQPNPQKLKSFMVMPPKGEKELQAFLGIIYYLGKFLPSTADTCKPLRKLTSVKREWTWNATYQKMFNKTKQLLKMCA